MKISSVTVKNYRSIINIHFNLYDYSMLIGQNNAGKSNIINAIRYFYGDISYSKDKDVPINSTSDDDSYIEIEYFISEGSNFDEQYVTNDKIKLRCYFNNKKQREYYLIANDSSEIKYSDNILGHMIYIPAVGKLEEYTKTSGKSALSELYSDIIEEVFESDNFKETNEKFFSYMEDLKKSKSNDGKSMGWVETELNNLITEWNVSFQLDTTHLDVSTVVKNLITFKLREAINNADSILDLDQVGAGLQRHLIYSLIILKSKLANHDKPKNELSLILFEEPETFLDPYRQYILYSNLKNISDRNCDQVLVTSHSPNFVSKNIDDLVSIIKLIKDRNGTKSYQLDNDTLNSILSNNKEIQTIVASDDINKTDDMEAMKYALYLDAIRCKVFFYDKVILVEGKTEEVLVNYIFQNNNIENANDIFILDCLGKYNIHRFISILSRFSISHAVLIDRDIKNSDPYKLNEFINGKKDKVYTKDIKYLEHDLESYLGIGNDKKNNNIKPQVALYKWLNTNEITDEKKDEFINLLNKLITLLNNKVA